MMEKQASTRRAFTLIELMVVIAITAVLMTIIVVPIIQSFNLTRAAQSWAEAQDKARTLTERIAEEINNASRIRDNSGALGELDVVVPARQGTGAHGVVGYDTTKDWVRVPIFNAKLDIIRPFEGDPSQTFGGAFINPGSGVGDPTLKAPKGDISLPSGPGMTLVRYFVGIRDPLRVALGSANLAGYIEPYTGLLQQRDSVRDNLFVLYRAQVQPMIWNNQLNKFVVNKAFFYDTSRNAAMRKTGPLLDDPTFFDPSVPYPAYDNPLPDDPTKAQMVQNWLRVATIQTEVSRFDMIQPIYSPVTRQVTYDGDVPRLMTLIQFQPARVSSEPAEGQVSVRQGEETDNSASIASDVFITKFPGWANTFLRTYPSTFVQGNPAFDKYEVGSILPNPAANDPQGLSIYLFDPEQNVNFTDIQTGQLVGGVRVGTELFDTYTYLTGVHTGIRANFSRGIAAANSRSGWLSNPVLHAAFEPYTPDFDRGRSVASYSINEVGVVGGAYPFAPAPLTDPINNPNNLPGALTWPDNTPPLSPFNDPNVVAGVFSDAAYSSINKKYNKIWHDYDGTVPGRPDLHGNIQRFIDLRVTPNDDGAPSPLYPDAITGFPRAAIVPGSEQVFGPDQNPGPNYGNTVRYARTTREPGPNQYKINYTNLREPTDYTLLGFSQVSPPATYTPTDFLSAVMQPRYKTGYLQFNSDPNLPLPGDPSGGVKAKILVYYRFQFTQPNDVMAVDYDSRQLMTVQMTIRDYPQSSLPNPQTVTLHSSASVRNFLR